MPRWKIAVAMSLSIAVAGVCWGYALPKKPGGTLTTQDYIEIQQLYANYAQFYDRGDIARYVGMFTPDGEFIGGAHPGETRNPLEGTAALTKMAQGAGNGSRHWT